MGQRPALSNTMPVVSATAGLPEAADLLWLALAMAVTGQNWPPALQKT
jgi:hypothetical protein